MFSKKADKLALGPCPFGPWLVESCWPTDNKNRRRNRRQKKKKQKAAVEVGWAEEAGGGGGAAGEGANETAHKTIITGCCGHGWDRKTIVLRSGNSRSRLLQDLSLCSGSLLSPFFQPTMICIFWSFGYCPILFVFMALETQQRAKKRKN